MARFSAANLNQGESVNISNYAKEQGDISLTDIYVGLGWDVHSTKEADLDVFFIQVDEHDRLIDLTYYGKKPSDDRAIYLSEDNRTGEGDGDDEYGKIALNKLNPATKKVITGVNIYRCTVSFNDVKNAFIRILDGKSRIDTPDEVVLVNYNLSQEFGNNFSMIVGEFIKNDDGTFDFKAIGRATKDRSIADVVKSITTGNYSPPRDQNQNQNDRPRKKFFGLF